MNRVLSIAKMTMVAATFGSIAGCYAATSSPQAQQAAPSTDAVGPVLRVSAARPVRKTLRLESVQPGQIEAFERTPLFAKLPCYVQKLYVDIGDRVEANQLLADLWLPELKEELRQKEAAVVEAQAEIEQAVATVGAAVAAVATAQANVSAAEAGNIRAEADFTRWQSQYTRISALVASGSLDRKLQEETQDSLKAAEAARAEARAKVESSKAMLAECQAGVRKTKANEAVARARRDKAEADHSRQQALLQYTQIRAPYAGVVTERNVVRGDFVQPATSTTAKPLLAVARTDIVRIFVDVPELESPWVEAGRTGYVSVQALPDRVIDGKVTRTSWSLGQNRTLRTELDLPNPNNVLRPGMYATARILLQERANVLAIPTSAVLKVDGKTSCFCVENGRIVQRPIKLGLQVANDVEVTSGLAGDELVIQSPGTSLRVGQPVDVSQP